MYIYLNFYFSRVARLTAGNWVAAEWPSLSPAPILTTKSGEAATSSSSNSSHLSRPINPSYPGRLPLVSLCFSFHPSGSDKKIVSWKKLSWKHFSFTVAIRYLEPNKHLPIQATLAGTSTRHTLDGYPWYISLLMNYIQIFVSTGKSFSEALIFAQHVLSLGFSCIELVIQWTICRHNIVCYSRLRNKHRGTLINFWTFFQGVHSLLEMVMRTFLLKIRYLMVWGTPIFSATLNTFAKCSRGYAYSRGYVYSRV